MPRPREESPGELEGSARKKLKTSPSTSAAVVLVPAGMAPTPAKSSSPTQVTADGRTKEKTKCSPCEHEATLATLTTDLDAMRHLITCKICDRFLYEPFTLACGHTYCYSCLLTWLVNNRHKTCPDCRARVKHQPIPNFTIREMTLIFSCRDQLLPDGETVEQHQKWAKEEAELVSKDKLNTDIEKGGLFKGAFAKAPDSSEPPTWDPTDNVYRCPRCNWELEGGSCHHCSWGEDISDDLDDGSDEDEESLGTDEEEDDDEEEEEEDDELDLELAHDDVDGEFDPEEPYRAAARQYEAEREAESIAHALGYGVGYGIGYAVSRVPEVVYDPEVDPEMAYLYDDDHSFHGSSSEVEEVSPPRGRRTRQRQVAISDDEDDDDEDDDEGDEGDGDEEDDEEEDDDEEDDENDNDEGPIRPGSQRRHKRSERNADLSRSNRHALEEHSDGSETSCDENSASESRDDVYHESHLAQCEDDLPDYSSIYGDDTASEDSLNHGYGGDVFEGETGYPGHSDGDGDESSEYSEDNGCGWTSSSSM